MGIEPTSAAWEAAVLPLNYTRVAIDSIHPRKLPATNLGEVSVTAFLTLMGRELEATPTALIALR